MWTNDLGHDKAAPAETATAVVLVAVRDARLARALAEAVGVDGVVVAGRDVAPLDAAVRHGASEVLLDGHDPDALEDVRQLVAAGRHVLCAVAAEPPELRGRLTQAHADCIVTPFVAEELRARVSGGLVFASARMAQHGQRSAEERYRFLAESMPHLVWTSTQQGQMDYSNEAFAKYTGRRSAELLGTRWIEAIHPEDRPRIEELRLRRIRAGVAYSVEFRLRREDGEFRWFQARVVPRHEDGKIVQWVASAIDVEDLKEADARMRRAQKMDAVARVAGAVAHEFNNMMAAVLGFSALLLRDIDPGDPRRGDVQAISEAAERAASVTRQLLAFSGGQLVRPVPLALSEQLIEMLPVVQRMAGPGIDVEIHAHVDNACVRLDRGQFEEVLLNLAMNAFEAMPGGGRLTIESDVTEFDSLALPRHPDATVAPGRYAMLAVSDTGHGIAADVRPHVFEPFFTTHCAAEGRGLGLAVVYGIVKQAGGYVWVYSEPGHGATFKVYLPQLEVLPAAVPPPVATQVVHGTVLVVDDEPLMRRLGGRILAQEGFQVLEAANVSEAWSLLVKGAGSIDVVLTDIVMPGGSGRELGERIASEFQGVRVLYMSGYTDDEVLRRGLLPRGVTFLQKPFGAKALVEAVRALLGQGTDARA